MVDYIEKYSLYMQNDRHKSVNTIQSYKRDLSQFISYLNANNVLSPKSANKTDIISYFLELQSSGRAAASISRMLTSIRSYYSYLLRTGEIEVDPTDRLEAPKIEKKQPKILSEIQIKRLLNAPNVSDSKGLRDKAMMELLYASGIRVSELIGLKLSDVNVDVKYVRCNGGTNKERYVPIDNMAADVLAKYIRKARPKLVKDNKTDYLFINCNGSGISRQGFWKIIKYYGNAAEINSEITPHVLRHSFAAHLVENGADLKSVQTMMGHSSITSTQIYSSFINTHIREVYEKAHSRA